MYQFIARRLLSTIPVLVIVAVLVFMLLRLTPGDPAAILAGDAASTEQIEGIRETLGLDRPLPVQFGIWVGQLLRGDLGESYYYKVRVTELIAQRLEPTLSLAVLTIIIAILVAVPLGIWAALRKGGRVDYFVNLFAFAGISVPSFWIAIVLILVFAVYLPLFPAGGTASIDFGMTPMESVIDRARHLVLPVLSLSFLSIGTFVRYTRAAMIEAMSNDYIRTARAKGLSWERVLFVHGFRNALIPLITIVTLSFSTLFSGAIITETVFAYDGVGRLVFLSIQRNDFNVAMVAFMISVSWVLLMNFAADLLYGLADPRITYS